MILAGMLFYQTSNFGKTKNLSSSTGYYDFHVSNHVVICVGFHYITRKAANMFFFSVSETAFFFLLLSICHADAGPLEDTTKKLSQ